MPRRYLPALDFEATVSAETARQDKIEITMDHGIVTDDPGDVELFLHFLGPPPENQASECTAFGRIFNRARRRTPDFYEQLIRTRATPEQPLPPPLFAGSLRVHRFGERESTWTFSSALRLNPTRFVRHQQFPRPIRSIYESDPDFVYRRIRADAPPLDHGDEFALLEADNWIPDHRFWCQYASPPFWQRHLRHYLRSSVREIQRDLRRAGETPVVRIVPSAENPFNVHSVESYWEFFHEDPIGTVRLLQPMLEMFAAAPVDSRDYLVRPVTADMPENSRRLSLQTRNGEALKIYAKTNRRIRFEITHQLSGPADAFRLMTGGHTFATIEGALPLLAHLSERAAETVNALLRHFLLNASIPATPHSLLQFIFDFQAAFGDPYRAWDLLQILVNNGSLVRGHGIPLGRVFEDEIRRLIRRGILHASHGRITVMPAYTQAFSTLRERGMHTVLGFRRRVRMR